MGPLVIEWTASLARWGRTKIAHLDLGPEERRAESRIGKTESDHVLFDLEGMQGFANDFESKIYCEKF